MAKDERPPLGTAPGRFPQTLAYQAARLYYLERATQAQIAAKLGTSRPTVSRLLAQARDTGLVTVDVREPEPQATADLAAALVDRLALAAAYVTPPGRGVPAGELLAPAVGEALQAADLRPGDGLLVSSGRTLYTVAQQSLPSLHGVVLCPTMGGLEEVESHYQTNEITRTMAIKLEGVPVMLYAPAMPTAALREVLLEDPSIRRVTSLWRSARAALLGIGAPPHGRSSLPSVIKPDSAALVRAVGDICVRPFDQDGRPIAFEGVERLVAIEFEDLRRIPHTIGAAAGADKVESIRVAIDAGLVNTLVTDSDTAELLLAGSALG